MKSLMLIALALFANLTHAETMTQTTLDANNAFIENRACVTIDLGSAALLRQLADSIGASLYVDPSIPALTLGQVASNLKACIELANSYHTPSGQRVYLGAIYLGVYDENRFKGPIFFGKYGNLFIVPTDKQPLDLQKCYNVLMTQGYFH